MKTAVRSMPSSAKQQEITSTKQRVCSDHKNWLKANPKATLGQLLTWLKEAHEQIREFVDSGDPVIEESEYIPSTLADYLSAWDSHDGEPFSYRESNLEEDIELVTELIEELGDEMLVAELPK